MASKKLFTAASKDTALQVDPKAQPGVSDFRVFPRWAGPKLTSPPASHPPVRKKLCPGKA